MCNFKITFVLSLMVVCLSACSQSPEFSFGLVADIQYADREPAGVTDYRASLQKCAKMAEQFNSEKLAFAVQLGDFIDCQYASYDSILPIWNRVQTVKYNVPGNHDYVPKEASSEHIYKRLSLAKSYYDFNYGRWRFIVLNSSDVSLYANEIGSEKHVIAEKMLAKLKAEKSGSAHPWNGAVGKEQMEWFKGKLQSADKNGEKVIIFAHHPVQPAALWNSGEVIEVIEEHDCVFAFVSGHLHTGRLAENEGIYHWVLNSMLSSPEKTSYSVVDVYRDRIEIRGTGREPDMTLMIE